MRSRHAVKVRLYLLRHGKTMASEQRLYCGSSDLSLSVSGRAELRALKAVGKYPAVETIWSSDLKRARETAELIYQRPPERLCSDFRELDFGDFELLGYEQLKTNPDYCRWLDDPWEQTPPAGESFSHFAQRVERGIDEIVALKNSGCKELLLVSHGGVVALIMMKLCPGEKDFYAWAPPLGGGYQILMEKNQTRIDYKLL